MIKRNLYIFILVFISNVILAQNSNIEGEYIRRVRFLGVPFNGISFFSKKSSSIIFKDSSYVSFITINKTISQGYTKKYGKYYRQNNKIVLFSKDKKYKVLKIKSNYLFNNILFGVIREEYYFVK